MRLYTRATWRCSNGNSMNLSSGLIQCNFPFYFNFLFVKSSLWGFDARPQQAAQIIICSDDTSHPPQSCATCRPNQELSSTWCYCQKLSRSYYTKIYSKIQSSQKQYITSDVYIDIKKKLTLLLVNLSLFNFSDIASRNICKYTL